MTEERLPDGASEEDFSLTNEEAFSFREREVETPDGAVTISYIVCEPLEEAGFLNAFSTRLGGVSPLPAKALNLTNFQGDTRENVTENRRRFLEVIGAEGMPLVTARQTHSTERCFIESAQQAVKQTPECDAMTTRAKGLLLAIQTADCLPVLIGDTKSGAMAAIHAGWRGTAGRIVERTMADLMRLGVNPRHCIAALGPCASCDHYEVGTDVIERYKKEFRYWKNLLVNPKEGGKAYLDVRAANVQQLAFCGFDEDQIFVAPYCTMGRNDLFFSYRKEAGGEPRKVGRLLSVIGKKV
jgi:purine-nucleoside/S-methyl-5'-thioadenosine phosphorylase / adenosine deaminase